MTRAGFGAGLLLALGLAQITADVVGWTAVKGVAAASGASPAPKVFSAVRGLETYSTQFVLEVGADRYVLTSERYAGLRGPYNRRNVYGAALSYAPVLPATMRDPVMHRALCGEAPILRELGIPRPAPGVPVAVTLAPLPGTSLGDLQTRFTVSCDE